MSNAIKWFRHDTLLENYRIEDITVGALRAKALAKGVDITPKSSGGIKPENNGRPVTSGDIIAMSKAAAEERTAA